jgi:hypothetical protein
MTSFYAWVTTDITCLDQGCADVVVLRDENDVRPGETNEPLFTATTTVDAKDGDQEDAIREATELLEAAGWKKDGAWEPVTTGAIVTVTRA